jgi:hydroxyacylglutathione hydrolase
LQRGLGKANFDGTFFHSTSDQKSMQKFKSFTGGPFDTNCFLYAAPEGNILFDAPPGADAAFANERIALLLLTHGHYDHVADAAAILRRHGCPVAYHPDTAPMVTDPEFFRRWGFGLEVEPFTADFLIGETPATTFLGAPCAVLDVPGHCPGSVCFHLTADAVLVGGDVLFHDGVGRWDLPGGDRDLLFRGIVEKLFPLPETTTVLPGHGPATTIGRERRENPFFAEEP